MRKTTTILVAIAALVWVSALGPAPLEAQVVRGTIRDSKTSEPVVLAYVGLLAPGRELVVAGLADSYGAFSLQAPAGGEYFIYVARMGYNTILDGLFELGDDGVFDLQIGLTPAAIEVEDLVVESESRLTKLETVGFYQRAERGVGTFLLAEQIRTSGVDKFTDAMRNLPGVQIDATRPLFGPDALKNPELLFRRGGGVCSPTLYIDGHVVAFGSLGRGNPVRPDDFVDSPDVEAVEIYVRPSEIPIEYQAAARCGVVLIWTFIR